MKKIEMKTILKVGAGIFLLYLAIHYWPVIARFGNLIFAAGAPLLIGCVIAYPLNILMSFYERHFFQKSRKVWVQKSRRGICVLLALITLVAIVAGVIALIVPQLVSCVMLLVEQIPDAITNLLVGLEEYDLLSADVVEQVKAIDWQSRLGDIFKTVFSGLSSAIDVVVTMVSSVVSGVTTGVLALIFAIYVLFGKEKLGSQWNRLMKRYVKETWCQRIAHVMHMANDSFHRFIVGQCTEAVILGVLCTIGMLILRLPYAPMIGAVMAFTALIPVVGAFVGGAVGVFLIMMESPLQAVIFLIFLVVLQQLENTLIYPKVVGASIGLPGIWVLTAVTIGGGVLGVFGMLLGVPAAATVYRLLRENVNQPPKKKETIETKTEE